MRVLLFFWITWGSGLGELQPVVQAPVRGRAEAAGLAVAVEATVVLAGAAGAQGPAAVVVPAAVAAAAPIRPVVAGILHNP